MSGECADEMFSGSPMNVSNSRNRYIYNKLRPTLEHMEADRVERLERLHQYDVLRGDRVSSRFGLEIRVPFASKRMLDASRSISSSLRDPL